MPAGSLAKAASVGANTVSLSLPERTPSSLAATMAATRVLWEPVPLADSTMFCIKWGDMEEVGVKMGTSTWTV